MTTPRVIELPRRLEPVGRDTFLGGAAIEAPTPQINNVITLAGRNAVEGVPDQSPSADAA